jgi:hypothetical protein
MQEAAWLENPVNLAQSLVAFNELQCVETPYRIEGRGLLGKARYVGGVEPDVFKVEMRGKPHCQFICSGVSLEPMHEIVRFREKDRPAAVTASEIGDVSVPDESPLFNDFSEVVGASPKAPPDEIVPERVYTIIESNQVHGTEIACLIDLAVSRRSRVWVRHQKSSQVRGEPILAVLVTLTKELGNNSSHTPF